MIDKISYPLLLDGGLSNQLESQGCDIHSSLWTAELLRSDPEQIIKAHLAYLEAGAQCIITSSYQATIPGFVAMGMDSKMAKELILKSVELASEATGRYHQMYPNNPKPLIASSIGPYGAYLADGSEYRGNYRIPRQSLLDFHARKIELLDQSDADLLACETIPDYHEASVLSEILQGSGTPSWMTFSCRDEGHICDGTGIERCVELIADNPGVFAVGVNCTPPQYISGLIEKIRSTGTTKKIIVYPNSGETYHAYSGSWSGDSAGFPSEWIREWIDLGADIIGGCCRVGPGEIRQITLALADR